MLLTDSQVDVIVKALKMADEADKQWEELGNTLVNNKSSGTLHKIREAREAYYQEAAKLHLLMRTIFKEVEESNES
jgi:hypothetical protein